MDYRAAPIHESLYLIYYFRQDQAEADPQGFPAVQAG